MQDINASQDSIPVGFRSFAHEDDAQMRQEPGPQEMSFAKEMQAQDPSDTCEQVVLREIQNRGSLGGEETHEMPSKANLGDVVASRRDGKLSQKKSNLYLKIMKDHGLEGKTTPKLNYDISSLVHKTPVEEILKIGKVESADNNTNDKAKLTKTLPFDFQTEKRIRLQFEE